MLRWVVFSLAAVALAGCSGSSQRHTADQQAAIVQAKAKVLATGYTLDRVTKIVPTVRGSDTWHIEGRVSSAKFGHACVVLNGVGATSPWIGIKDCR